MGDHHALGRLRRPRGVLQEREAIARQLRLYPGILDAGLDVVGGHPLQRKQFRDAGQALGDVRQNAPRRQHERRLGIRHDRKQARRQTIHARQISRHGDDARIQAAEEGRDIFQARRINQNRAVAGILRTLQPSGDGARLAIKFGVCQIDFFGFAVGEKSERSMARSFQIATLQQVDEGLNIYRCRFQWRICHLVAFSQRIRNLKGPTAGTPHRCTAVLHFEPDDFVKANLQTTMLPRARPYDAAQRPRFPNRHSLRRPLGRTSSPRQSFACDQDCGDFID